MAIAATAIAQTEAFPARPIKLIVPFAPGGGNDILARIVGRRMQAAWGQPWVIENRPGAGGNIGAEAVARAAPDGYTVLLATNTLAINPAVFKQMPFDTRQDFAPVALLAATPFALVVNPSLPVKSTLELIAYAKARPGQLSYASPGIGTPHHLGMELFRTMTGIDVVHVPYKGSVAALTDLASGQIQLMLITINAGMPFMQAGKVRGLAIAEKERVGQLRELPTVSESGVPGFEVSAWYALLAPAKTPPEIIRKMSEELVRALAEPEVRQQLESAGFEVTPGSAAQVRSLLSADLDKWARVAKAAGIKPE